MSLADLLSDPNRTQREKLEILRVAWRGELERLDEGGLYDALRSIDEAITSKKLRTEVLLLIAELRRDGAAGSAPLPEREAKPSASAGSGPATGSASERSEIRNIELEERLAAAPRDYQTWQVYRDWLESRGLTHEGKLALGRLAECDDMLSEVEWRHGFIRRARLRYTFARFNRERPQLALALPLAWLLDEPGPGRLIESLTIGLARHDENHYGEVCAAIGARLRPCLAELAIGDFDYEECELNWSTLGDASPLWPALPNLRSLWLRAGNMVTLGDIVLPELRRFETVTGGLSAAALRSIAAATWPKLERLHLQIGRADEGAASDVELVAPILAATGLPALVELGLTNCEFTDELCERLVAAPIVRQLRRLDLSMGTMGIEGARALAEHPQAFAHLEQIVVDDNYLPDEARGLLAPFGPALVFGSQRAEGDYGRYASAIE